MIEKEKQQVLSIFDEAIYKVSHKLLRIELRKMTDANGWKPDETKEYYRGVIHMHGYLNATLIYYFPEELYDYIENNMKPHLLKSMVQSQKAADEKKKQDEAEAAVANENNSLQSVDAGQMSDKNKLQEGAACQKEAFDEDAFDREEIELFEEIMEGIYGEEI